MKEELKILIEAKYPLIYLVTSEEGRSEQAILALAQTKPQRRLFVWTVTHGIAEYDQSQNTTQHSTVSPEAAIEWVVRQRDPSTGAGIYIFKDLHPFIASQPVTPLTFEQRFKHSCSLYFELMSILFNFLTPEF